MSVMWMGTGKSQGRVFRELEEGALGEWEDVLLVARQGPQ